MHPWPNISAYFKCLVTYILVSTVEDACAAYQAVLSAVRTRKFSRHKALVSIGKDLKSFVNFSSIYELKVTRPDVFQEVGISFIF